MLPWEARRGEVPVRAKFSIGQVWTIKHHVKRKCNRGSLRRAMGQIVER